MNTMRIVVTGGSGFIGSNLVDRLMREGHHVTVVDNLKGGSKEFIAPHFSSQRFKFFEIDVRDTTKLEKTLNSKIDLVYHLAANSDISRGVEDPTLDLEHSILATFSLLQVMRAHNIKKLVYTSGSGVYGDIGAKFADETLGPLRPVSMYGASKLSAEALISAFAHLFDFQAWILRPANIIGPRLTHGVVFDFIKRLKKDPSHLKILGDGKQSKAYLHVDDVLDALMLVQKKSNDRVNFYNLSSTSFISVNAIANEVLSAMKIKEIPKQHTGGKSGWKGDVPIMRLHNNRLHRLGWRPGYTSKQAVKATIQSLLSDPRME